ncbi:MAG: pantetheine-phosphate adenylyltransferase [Proteobacteria bacterium SG_bin7]|nr:MAG: pantetheine-phosphate adenylyltransferase [Proteobacteria bacterium SG_bin7]
MNVAIYPGSFDPITLGHIDLITRALNIFDQVVVLVAQSSRKQYMFNSRERKDLIVKALGKRKNVKVEAWDGLTTDFAKKTGAKIILRGVRSSTDFDHEIVLAQMNKKLAPDLETCVFFPSAEFQFIASSAIKEIAKAGGDLEAFVPSNVVKALKEKYARR